MYYRLTRTAENDFRRARQWSQKRWGAQLTKQYFLDLHNAAEHIALHYARTLPTPTHHTIKEILPDNINIGVHPVREHYIVYVPVAQELVAIIALIRQTRDVPAILKAHSCLINKELKEIANTLTSSDIRSLRKS